MKHEGYTHICAIQQAPLNKCAHSMLAFIAIFTRGAHIHQHAAVLYDTHSISRDLRSSKTPSGSPVRLFLCKALVDLLGNTAGRGGAMKEQYNRPISCVWGVEGHDPSKVSTRISPVTSRYFHFGFHARSKATSASRLKRLLWRIYL